MLLFNCLAAVAPILSSLEKEMKYGVVIVKNTTGFQN